jgi:hypothetical protein
VSVDWPVDDHRSKQQRRRWFLCNRRCCGPGGSRLSSCRIWVSAFAGASTAPYSSFQQPVCCTPRHQPFLERPNVDGSAGSEKRTHSKAVGGRGRSSRVTAPTETSASQQISLLLPPRRRDNRSSSSASALSVGVGMATLVLEWPEGKRREWLYVRHGWCAGDRGRSRNAPQE